VRHRIKNRPLVSIVIPTAGRTRRSGQTIDCCTTVCDRSSRNRHDNYEILIADNGTITDATAYWKRFPTAG
jgi:glycosyltransferase involved in cell wall biosynthesis